jgi:deoxyribose-phosphate aldolase
MMYPTILNTPSARTLSQGELAKRIQFTLVKPNATRQEMIAHIEAGVAHGFHAVMIPMCWVPLARTMVSGSAVRVATCIGLSMGHESLHAKIALLRECRALGADEVDYEPNMGYFLSGMYDEFSRESKALVEAADGMPIKTMLELGYIEREEDQRLAARLLDEAGVPWVKNSSGVGPGSIPATPENIRLLRESVTRARVKASGKVNSYEGCVAVLDAGAELVGTSAGIAILSGMAGEGDY